MSTSEVALSPADAAAFSGPRKGAAAAAVPPALAEHLAALDRYRAAVEELAKVEAHAARVEARRVELLGAVREAQDVMRATTPGRKSRAAGGDAPRGTMRAAIFAALPGTMAEVAARTGLDSAQVSGQLAGAYREGLVTRSGERGSYVWARAEAGPP